MKKTILVLLLLCTVGFPVNRYVSTTGNNANSGLDTAHAWATINYATYATENINKINAGDTLFIRGGIYHEHTILIKNKGISSNNRIVIKSYRGELATIDGDSVDEVFSLGYYEINNWITIDSLRIINGLTNNLQVGYNQPCSSVVIKNCILENHKFVNGGNCAGVRFDRGTSPVNDTVYNCKIVGSGYANYNYDGIMMMGSEGVVVKNCDISYVYTGIYFKHRNSGQIPTVIENNYIHNVVRFGMILSANYCKVKNNIIVKPITLTSSGGIVFWWDAGGDPSGSFCKVEHNTIHGMYTGINLQWNGVLDISCTPSVRGASYDTSLNNIFSATAYENGSYCLWAVSPDTALTNNPPHDTSDYNLYYNSGTTTLFRRINSRYTLAQWISTIYPTHNLHSLQNTPVFTNASGTMDSVSDYQLIATSPGYHAASDGKDMGADVSLVGADLGTHPTTITSQPQSDTVKSGETATFSVTATGSGLTYQWYGNNTLIEGATSSTYSFTAAKIYNGTRIWCLLTTDTTISTDTAILTVTDMTVDQTTDSLILNIPSDPLFTGQQWYEHDTAITGATALRFVVKADSAAYANKNYYYCKLWNTVNDTVQSGTWQLGLQPSGTKQKRWFGFKTGAFIGAWR